MNPGLTRRQWGLAAVLLATLGATAATWWQEHAAVATGIEVATAPERPAAGTPQPQVPVAPPPAGRNLTDPAADIFAVPKPSAPPPDVAAAGKPVVTAPPVVLPPPPPVQAAPMPPPKPAAPPLPFLFIGKLGDEAGQYTVFVSARGRNYAVKTGDTVMQQYRVDEIRPPSMTLTYLPMNIQQTMSIGEPN